MEVKDKTEIWGDIYTKDNRNILDFGIYYVVDDGFDANIDTGVVINLQEFTDVANMFFMQILPFCKEAIIRMDHKDIIQLEEKK